MLNNQNSAWRRKLQTARSPKRQKAIFAAIRRRVEIEMKHSPLKVTWFDEQKLQNQAVNGVASKAA